MSFRARLIHDLAIVTPQTEVSGDVDDYGQPVLGEPDVDLVAGLIQPRRATEVEATSQAGAVLATHVIFLERRALTAASYVRFEPDDGDRYEITGIRDYNFGRSPHLEVDAKRVVSEVLVTS